MEVTGGFSVRLILRAILATMLLLGSGAGDWLPISAETHESCCCGMPVGAEDSCPCPKPESNRTPSNFACPNRAISVAAVAVRCTQGQRRTEPRPEPATWAQAMDDRGHSVVLPQASGRDPDLGRHLAQLSTFRI